VDLVLKTSGLVDVLRTALAPLAAQIDLAFVFGSVAKSKDTASVSWLKSLPAGACYSYFTSTCWTCQQGPKNVTLACNAFAAPLLQY
jgi:hypothetical protein